MANLFIDGDNGKFNETADPEGNPPSDWNVDKDASVVLGYESANPIKEEGSFKFSTKSIFNDDYALQIIEEGEANTNTAQGIRIPIDLYDFTTLDFSFELRNYLDLAAIAAGEFPRVLQINSTGQALFRILYVSDTDIRFQWFTPTSTSIVQVPTLQAWQHIVVTFEHGVEAKLSVNGNIVNRLTDINIVDATQIADQGWFLGGAANSGQCKGYNRGLRIFNKALSDAEITSLYNSDPKNVQDVPISATGNLIQELLCNQEQGLEVVDTSNNENNLELNKYSNLEVSFGGGAWVDVSAI